MISRRQSLIYGVGSVLSTLLPRNGFGDVNPKRLVIVTGLAHEADVAQRVAPEAVVFCGQEERDKLDKLVPQDCEAILSFGLCGGMSADLKVGDPVVGSEVVNTDAGFLTDLPWSRALAESTGAVFRRVYSTGLYREADTPAQREMIHRSTGASIVDDESLAVMKLAITRGIAKAAVFRVVSDDYQDTIPDVASVAVRPDGTLNMTAALDWLTKNMGEVNHLSDLSSKFRVSLAALAVAAAKAGPSFGLR